MCLPLEGRRGCLSDTGCPFPFAACKSSLVPQPTTMGNFSSWRKSLSWLQFPIISMPKNNWISPGNCPGNRGKIYVPRKKLVMGKFF